jgi:queuine tRNA-ribosyltransferase subunit QTRTD1
MDEADGEGSTKLGASFKTSFGRQIVGPVKYMEVINACKPNLWASLPDEVPAWVSEKRNRMSVGRTLQWLDHCLSLSTVCHITLLYSFRAFHVA